MVLPRLARNRAVSLMATKTDRFDQCGIVLAEVMDGLPGSFSLSVCDAMHYSLFSL